MNEKTWLDYLVAAGTIATPILVLLLSGIGWRLRNRLERQFVLEDKLRDDRIRIYNDILKPFILLLTTDVSGVLTLSPGRSAFRRGLPARSQPHSGNHDPTDGRGLAVSASRS